ncbi:hypothetical protein HZS_3006 [Henneguya salminicola]|nr:hypothetical protein HZS_3006 [Henneguya salminicola]
MNLSYCKNEGKSQNNNGNKCKCEFGYTGNRCEFDCGLICLKDEFLDFKKIIKCTCSKKSWLTKFFYKNSTQLSLFSNYIFLETKNVLILCFCFIIISTLILCLILSFTKYRLNKILCFRKKKKRLYRIGTTFPLLNFRF